MRQAGTRADKSATADIHITRELLRAASRGDLRPEVLTQIGLQHLRHLCPHCDREIAAWEKEQATRRAGHGRAAFEALPALLEAQAASTGSSMPGFPEPWTQLRLRWLRGKIAAGRGDMDMAERIFLEVRAGFLAQEIGYDAAMVVVEDLAPLYLRKGCVVEAKQLAEEAVAVFRAQNAPHVAAVALALLQTADASSPSVS